MRNRAIFIFLLGFFPLIAWGSPVFSHGKPGLVIAKESQLELDPTSVHLDQDEGEDGEGHGHKPKHGHGHHKTPPGKAKGHHHGHEDGDSQVPEPASWMMVSLGLLGLAWWGSKRQL
jgi:hypothetical protein